MKETQKETETATNEQTNREKFTRILKTTSPSALHIGPLEDYNNNNNERISRASFHVKHAQLR